jgi:hypothetical protein
MLSIRAKPTATDENSPTGWTFAWGTLASMLTPNFQLLRPM